MADLTIKRGATLQLLISVAHDDGSPVNLSGMTVTSQVRDQTNALTDTLSIVQTGITGQLSVQQPTDAWPLGSLSIDFKISQSGVVLKSQTLSLDVEAAVTQ